MSRLLALLLLACLSCPIRAAAPPRPVETRAPVVYRVRQVLDVPYYRGTSRQTLDVFAPQGAARERFPVVVFVHGGTWMVGGKNFFGIYRNVGRNLARHGVVAVMINYRLSPWVRHPEHVKDVARAYAWTVRHIDRHGGDPRRIILGGHSAGGHLAALLATDERYLKDPRLKLTVQQRKALRGVVALSGVYRVPDPDEFQVMSEGIIRHLAGDPTRRGMSRLMTPVLKAVAKNVNPFELVFGRSREVQDQASPLHHVHKGLPPFLLVTAEYEVPRLRVMADDFAAALGKVGTSVKREEIDGCSHRTIVNRLHQDDHEVTRLVLDFVKTQAGGPMRSTP
jgi:acetyl esterase/lipase